MRKSNSETLTKRANTTYSHLTIQIPSNNLDRSSSPPTPHPNRTMSHHEYKHSLLPGTVPPSTPVSTISLSQTILFLAPKPSKNTIVNSKFNLINTALLSLNSQCPQLDSRFKPSDQKFPTQEAQLQYWVEAATAILSKESGGGCCSGIKSFFQKKRHDETLDKFYHLVSQLDKLEYTDVEKSLPEALQSLLPEYKVDEQKTYLVLAITPANQ